MDPLSLTVSITALLEVIGIIIGYLNDVRDASEDRFKFAMELYGLNNLLTVLRNRVKDATGDSWFATVRALGVENGPLDQFRSNIVRLASKLEPVDGIEKVKRALTWKFDKTEIVDILSRIERIKTLVSLALENDLL